MKKSKVEGIIVCTCAALCAVAALIFGSRDEVGIAGIFAIGFFVTFLVYALIDGHRREKPIYDRAKRLKALREKSQSKQ